MFAFDTVVTNRGNAYNNYSGIFTAPSSGLYAFSYPLHMSGDHDRENSVQLVRNGSPADPLLRTQKLALMTRWRQDLQFFLWMLEILYELFLKIQAKEHSEVTHMNIGHFQDLRLAPNPF